MKKILVLIILLSLVLFSCNRDGAKDGGQAQEDKSVKEVVQEDSSKEESDSVKVDSLFEADSVVNWAGKESLFSSASDEPLSLYSAEEQGELLKKLSKSASPLKERKFKKSDSSKHAGYLDDPMEFTPLAESEWKGKMIGVIGSSDDVKLYSSMDGSSELAGLPLGTVVEIVSEHKNSGGNEDEGDYFKFKEEYNYWYQVLHEGKKGYVFGSYLISSYDVSSLNIATLDSGGLNRKSSSSIEERLMRLAHQYKLKERSESFYSFNGAVALSPEVKACLEKQRFVLTEVDKNEYALSVQDPDDMISLYKDLHNDRTATTFITMDFLVHNLHLLFGRMMEDTEANALLPMTAKLVVDYYEAVEQFEKDNAGAGPEVEETVAIAKKYLLVAGALLNIKLMEWDEMPEDVKEELNLIAKAEGFVESAPVFGYKEDYSQFKPRGHYTKSAELKSYFRTMIWFGRLHFNAKMSKDEKEMADSVRLTRAALLLTKLAKENKNIYGLWQGIFTPITYIVGESDDYTLNDYFEVSDGVDFNNFAAWLSDDENVEKFISEANSRIKPPAISGNSLFQDGEMAEAPPAGFRLFGQRFTFDSFIHNQLSAPRVKMRPMVKGLDVMAVFGSEEADNLLAEDKEGFEEYPVKQAELKESLAAFKPMDWRKTFYNSYLRIIRESALFDHKSGFYFTQDKLWDRKSLLTAHGGWAELRHDTILYVKQSYAEMAGKGPEKSWVIEKVARPIGYVEPNMQAVYWLQSTLADAITVLKDNGFMSDSYAYKFETYKDAVDKLVEIVELQVADKAISFEQNEFIYSLPGMLGPVILPANATDYMEEKDLQMALVADVHTDSDNGVVLEVATGKPYRIYVALNDGQGGKRIAEGYTYSYYEFTQPMNNRLNDDQWKLEVYGDKGVEDKRPQWIDDIICR